MKKQNPIRKIVQLLLTIILLLPLNSCHKESDDNDVKTNSISGVWEFTIDPLESYQDTTVVHGYAAKDFDEYTSIFSEVYLYEDQSNNIKGETLGYRILGSKNGNSVKLDLYVYPNGGYDEFISIDSMRLFSSMELIVDEFGYLKGVGNYSEYDDYPNIIYDKYEVNARKLNDVTISYKESKGWSEKLCKLTSNVDDAMISDLTDNVFRPMHGCYGYKDGGGYYVFGHEGPGNKLPIYTATVYYPLEWSWCKVRKYDFTFTLGDENYGYAKLKEEIGKLEDILHISHNSGYDSENKYIEDLDDFERNFGGFAITVVYDTHTQNIGLYINHKGGDNKKILFHPFITNLTGALDILGGEVFVKSGETINDSWHLRRSDLLVCNSMLCVFYLIGTHKVNYN